jgi:tRNA threonylcarbamoyladenosine biosynthesis protein TsaB
MNILSLDTTTKTLSCAVASDEKILAEFSLFTEKTHSERLMLLIDAILKSAELDISKIDYYACTVGPGSFTGLRIGISTIKGLAYANGKRVVAISSLDALLENVIHSPFIICPLIDARKGEVFAAFYKKGRAGNSLATDILTKSEEFNITPKDLVRKVDKKTLFLGNGVPLYKKILSSGLKEKAVFAPDEMNYIKGSNVSKLALKMIKAKKTIDPEYLVPTYIREPDAEINYKAV